MQSINHHVNVESVRNAAHGKWREILPAICNVGSLVLDEKHHPCPRCGGKDRFRAIDVEVGALFCNKCYNEKNGDGFAAVMWLTGCTFPNAVDAVADHLGLIRRNGQNPHRTVNVVEAVARLKRMPIDALRRYGARIAKRNGNDVCRVPMYGADRNVCGNFDMATTGDLRKGMIVRGEKSGLFVPNDWKPNQDDTVYITEGVKDAAALLDQGYATIGICGRQINANLAGLFADLNVVIVPDLDKDGQSGAETTASYLFGVAASVCIARLSGKMKKKGGDGVREILARPDGEKLLKESLQQARLWEPNSEKKGGHGSRGITERYEQFPVDTLPKTIREFVTAAAKAIGCDVSYLVLPVLSVLAAAIGNTHRLQLKRSWNEPAIIWTAIIGESGTMKSPALDLAVSPVKHRQSRALLRYRDDMQEYEVRQAVYDRDLNHWRRSKKGGDPPQKPEEPIAERFWCDDQTVEALAPLLQNQPRGLLMAKDELAGWWNSFDQYRSGKGGDSARWIEMFGGRAMQTDRKTGPKLIYVPRAAISIAGGIQPGILRRCLTQTHRESGLAARVLMAYPPRRPKRWTDNDVPVHVADAYGSVVDRLYSLSMATDADGEDVPTQILMAAEAQREMIDFVNRHGEEQLAMYGDLSSAWSKLEGYAPRLALVIHLTRWASGEAIDRNTVDVQSVQSAITMVRWFSQETRRIYSMLDESETEGEYRRLVEWIENKGGSVTAREVQQGHRRYRTAEEADTALCELQEAGIGHWEPTPRGQRGQPTRRFVLSTVYGNAKIPEKDIVNVDVDGVDGEENSDESWGYV